MSLKYSRELSEKVKFHSLESTSMKAMADLMLFGWSEKDAYILAYSPEMSSNETFINNRIKAIIKTDVFKKYMNVRSMAIVSTGTDIKKDVSTDDNEQQEEFKPMSKEDVLRDLQGMLALTPLGDRKGRSEILKSIADLMRYKDEIVEGTSDSKKYYLPKKCYHCEWYKGREKDKIL